MTFCVFWCNTDQDGNLSPSHKEFNDTQMGDALTFMEGMRKTAEEDGVHFITMASENPNSVGKAGVDVTGPDYNWKKRRS